MHDLGLRPVEIRPKVGVRRIGKKLCLSNLERGESWMCSGSSPMIWQKLQEGKTPNQIAEEISQKYNVPKERVLTDVLKFVEHLWERQILDLPERQDVSDEQRAQLVKEQPHNVSQRVAAAAVEAERLCTCVFDLLVPCNLRCRHCYLDFSHTDVMPLADVCNYLDQLADHGCPEVTFTGGEIFLRRDFIEIVAHAEQRGFLINMITNGTFINQQKADDLAQYALQTVKMSIYGSTAPLHEAVTKKAGTFEKTVHAAKLLIERGITVDFAYFVQNHNFKDAFEFPKFARKMGAKHSFDTKLVPNRNGSKDPLQYGVTVQQQAELFRSNVIHREVEFVCTAAASKARITASADVYPCELINTASLGNLKRQTLEEIWASTYRAEMRAAILGYKPKRCGGCNHTSDCEPCAAMRGFNQEGHMEAPVSEACLLTTASLLAQGKVMEPSSPFQKFAESCVDQVLAADRNPGPHHNLVQIMTARIEGT